MSARTFATTAVVGTALATTLAVSAPSPADAAAHHRVTDWAPAATATLHPGTMMYTKGAQCTANFVYTDAVGHVYVGYAAHCAGLGEATDTDGCSTRSVPLGTKVGFREGGSLADGGTKLATGHLAYSSWRTMKKLHTQDANTCAYNDLALVRVAKKDVDLVNPSVPVWGGPTGIDTDGTAAGDQVFTYGNSSLRGGTLRALAAHRRQPGRRRRGRWLVAPALHRVTGHPRRLRLRFPLRGREGDRRPLDARPRATARPRTTSATWPRSSPSPRSTRASRDCG